MKVRGARPSLFDRRFTADIYVIDHGNGDLFVGLGDYELAHITGLSFDIPSLNQILRRIWHLKPRQTK